MLNIMMGALAIVAGLSGKFALFGTNSPWALVVFGIALMAYGGYQLNRQR